MKKKTLKRAPRLVASTEPVKLGNADDQIFHNYVGEVRNRFLYNCQNGAIPLFTTDVNTENLYNAYIQGFAPTERQYHTCHECRRFIQKYGALVTIDDKGRISSAIWNKNDAPLRYKGAVSNLIAMIESANVTGVFLSSETSWGLAKTGAWSHFSVYPPASMVYPANRSLNSTQAIAQKLEDFKNMQRAMSEYSHKYVTQALVLLESDTLYRADNVKGPAVFLDSCYKACNNLTGQYRENALWRLVATAPTAFCHPRSSMIGTLLDDIAAGFSYDDIARRFADKMNPGKYQRPTAAPKAGNIDAAEKLVEKLGIERSFARRYARLDEIQTIWTPNGAPKTRTGLFKDVVARNETVDEGGMTIPRQNITWAKFRRDVLPGVEKIEIKVPVQGNYAAIVTAYHEDAPPILQWDTLEQRNPFSWYVYQNGSHCGQWNVRGELYYLVNALTLKPCLWYSDISHHGNGLIFIINGAKDTQACGSALFPEILKSDLHGIRSVVEAYSKKNNLAGINYQSASGLLFDDKNSVTIRVRKDGNLYHYRLDRWE